MPEDDLEYFITFPSPIPKCPTPGSTLPSGNIENDYILVGSQGKEPVVFLLGWLGAQDHHLSKYSEVYNNFGCITIRYTAPSSNMFLWTETNMKYIARRLVDLFEEMNLEDHPIIFHSFSNHGSRLYYYISNVLEAQINPKIKVRGCIFDSAPSPRKIFRTVVAIYRATPGPMWSRLMAAAGIFVYLVVWTTISVGSTLVTGKFPLTPPWALIEEKLRVPQLLLYSRADDIISYEDIEAFAAARTNLGVPVITQMWEDSKHVQHLRKYSEEYKETVYSFLAMCLSPNPVTISAPQPSSGRLKEE